MYTAFVLRTALCSAAGMDGEGIVACRLQACVRAGSSERDILYSPLHTGWEAARD
jgi:hypothetical protein